MKQMTFGWVGRSYPEKTLQQRTPKVYALVPDWIPQGSGARGRPNIIWKRSVDKAMNEEYEKKSNEPRER